jgi:hypothetical protein
VKILSAGTLRTISFAAIVMSCVLGEVVCAMTPFQLFVIERNKNANIVVYEAKLDDRGDFVPDAPVVAYWKLNATTGAQQSLSLFDKRAYGFSIKKDIDSYQMTLAPFKNRPIQLLKEGKIPRAQMTINGIQSWLSKVYVKAKEGTLLPKVEYIELYGTAVATGQKTYEKMVP